MNLFRQWITYNGKSLAEFGVYISGSGVWNSPARSIESVAIPGRNGQLTIDNGHYENIVVTYPAFIIRGFRQNIEGLRNYLGAQVGYKRLEDTYHPDEFRMARVLTGITVTPSEIFREGEFDLAFDCKPERFLKSGEQPLEFNGDAAIYNATLQNAKPLIRVWGNGEVGIGDYTFTLTGTSEYTDVDCENMDAYYEAENRNSKFSGQFPVLVPGANGIALGTGIQKIQITPRWWIL